jgi:hypothetical protein
MLFVIFSFSLNQAKNDDLQTDYEHMKKSFDRLKSDHTKLDSEHRNNFAELKEKNEKIIVALQSKCYGEGLGECWYFILAKYRHVIL